MRKKYYKWLKLLRFENEFEQMTLEEYTDEIKRLEDKIDRLDKRIAEAAESSRYAERVRKLRAFRGIDYLTALSPMCEIGDYRRFSSGKKRKQGGITKTGNGHLRRLLIESLRHYARAFD